MKFFKKILEVLVRKMDRKFIMSLLSGLVVFCNDIFGTTFPPEKIALAVCPLVLWMLGEFFRDTKRDQAEADIKKLKEVGKIEKKTAKGLKLASESSTD